MSSPTRIPGWVPASILASLNAMPFGLDTGTIGPVTTMKSFLSVVVASSSSSSSSGGDGSTEINPTIHGVLVSSILLTGVLGALIAGNLADRYGRARITSFGSLLFCCGATLECASVALPMFIIGRLIKGIGEGFFLSTSYVLVAETSPAGRRGMMANLPQLWITLGIVIGFFTCYGTEKQWGGGGGGRNNPSSASWRVPIGVQVVVAGTNGIVALLSGLVPESPRWLVATGKTEKARNVVARLGIPTDEADELFSERSLSDEDGKLDPTKTLLVSLADTFTEFGTVALARGTRSRTLFGIFIMSMLQFSGIDGVLYYAPTLFAQAGVGDTEATFLASGVSAIVILFVTIPATLFCDAWGRKTSSVVGGFGIFGIMILIGSLYASGKAVMPGGSEAARWTVVVCIYLFAAVFSATWALGLRTYMMESLPRRARSSGASLAQAGNWLSNYIVALMTPVFLAKSSFGPYYFFGFMSLACTLACLFCMTETKGFSLEYIEQRYSDKQASAQSSRRNSVNLWRFVAPSSPPSDQEDNGGGVVVERVNVEQGQASSKNEK